MPPVGDTQKTKISLYHRSIDTSVHHGFDMNVYFSKSIQSITISIFFGENLSRKLLIVTKTQNVINWNVVAFAMPIDLVSVNFFQIWNLRITKHTRSQYIPSAKFVPLKFSCKTLLYPIKVSAYISRPCTKIGQKTKFA